MYSKFDVMERECKNLEFGGYLNQAEWCALIHKERKMI
jgi:hypothetical protein